MHRGLEPLEHHGKKLYKGVEMGPLIEPTFSAQDTGMNISVPSRLGWGEIKMTQRG